MSEFSGRRALPGLTYPDESLKRLAAELSGSFHGVFAAETIERYVLEPLTDDVVQAADVVITMGCGDACPIYPGKRYVDWELVDPAGKSIDEVRRIRDQIRHNVTEMLDSLGVEPVALVL